jgi:aminopeptidase N
MTDVPKTVYLKDYAPTPYAIQHVEMTVRLDAQDTRISSKLSVAPRSNHPSPLVLEGEGLALHGIAIDGQSLPPSAYSYKDHKLTIHNPPNAAFALEISQGCNPSANSALSGLYVSNGIFCTQMEAEGFRRFAFFYDRPDVMATYRVRLEAANELPVLLANGNPVDSGKISGGNRHYAVWDDPHPKPTYLFALVCGNLASIHDSFTTSEGRTVALGIFVEKGKENACAWAMESLKSSMAWDERRFGRAYDLDVFNIVAVSDFNFGAMENKGLNIFNDKYILARPQIATDTDYVNIERIIAHEYFHNWTGNRVTCRDWFQLCLKEGLTVFRDQEFTGDMRSHAVKRIEDVKSLRIRQFPEDQGPLSHPVRPSSYMEINNFYTATVYDKGAEICRMLQTLIGKDAFRKATDLYFSRHDGEAATIEDFLSCMADASGRELSLFARWYEQAGTPIVEVEEGHDEKAGTFAIKLTQRTPPTPGQPKKLPQHLPLAYALLDDTGRDLKNGLIELKEESQKFTFDGLLKKPHLSLNRGFSAPIELKENVSTEELLFRMGHDSDSFNRWEAAQKLGMKLLLSKITADGKRVGDDFTGPFATALQDTLADKSLDNAFKALILQLPGEAEVTAAIGRNVDADSVHQGRNALRRSIASAMKGELEKQMRETQESSPYAPDTSGTARRSLRYSVLSLLALADSTAAFNIAQAELRAPHSMTAEMGALSAILFAELPEAEAELQSFHDRHSKEHLLVDKWFSLHGAWPRADAVAHVKAMARHADFRFTTPNRVYALIGSFTGNLTGFHRADGDGYRFLADTVITLNAINPQVAGRMATAFRSWRQYNEVRRKAAELHMRRILTAPQLSPDVFEIISRTLDAAKPGASPA